MTLAIAAFLSGAVTAVFVMLVAGIHAGDRPRHLTAAPDGHLEAFTRTMLGVGIRTGPHASHARRRKGLTDAHRQTRSRPAPPFAARHAS